MNNYMLINGQPRRNGQIPRSVQSPKTESGRNREYKQIPIMKLNQEFKKKKLLTKIQDQMASQVNFTKRLETS